MAGSGGGGMTGRRDSHAGKSGGARDARRPERNAKIPVAFNMVKPREYGTAKAVVGEAFKQAGGAKRVGAFFDLGLSTVYGFTDPDAKGCDLTLDRARRLTYVEGVTTAFAVDMAACAGGIFLKPGALETAEGLAALGSDISHSIADVIADLLKAISDGDVTAAERCGLLARTDIGIAYLVALRSRLMEGGAA